MSTMQTTLEWIPHAIADVQPGEIFRLDNLLFAALEPAKPLDMPSSVIHGQPRWRCQRIGAVEDGVFRAFPEPWDHDPIWLGGKFRRVADPRGDDPNGR